MCTFAISASVRLIRTRYFKVNIWMCWSGIIEFDAALAIDRPFGAKPNWTSPLVHYEISVVNWHAPQSQTTFCRVRARRFERTSAGVFELARALAWFVKNLKREHGHNLHCESRRIVCDTNLTHNTNAYGSDGVVAPTLTKSRSENCILYFDS